MGSDEWALGAVLAGARSGSARDFESVYAELAPSVASYLRWNGAADVEGLTNEVMANVHRGLERFVGDWPAFRSWVFTIAHHRLVDARRAARRRPNVVDELSDDLAAPGSVDEEAMQLIGDAEVRAMLFVLSVDQREVLLLRVVADLPLEEVASMLRKSVGAVKALQHRALATLRRHLAAEEARR